MTPESAISGFAALYIFMLAAFTGFEVVLRVPTLLHTPLMSGSNFVHGIVVVGAIFVLINASSSARIGYRIYRCPAWRSECRRRLCRPRANARNVQTQPAQGVEGFCLKV